MADFSNLYSPDISRMPVQTPDPILTPISPVAPAGNSGVGPDKVDSIINNMKLDLNTPTLKEESAPTPYNKIDTNEDRYTQSPYFQQQGFDPFRDNEEIYGRRQTIGNKFGNAVKGLGLIAFNQFKEQAGSWGDTFSFLKNNRSAFEKADMDDINKQQSELNNSYALYDTQKDKDSIFNWNTIFNTIQQSGYAVGAIAEIGAEELALTALTAVTFGGASELQAAETARLVGTVLRQTEQLGETVNSVSKWRKVLEGVNKVNPFIDNSLTFAADFKNINRADQVALGVKMGNLRTASKGFGSIYRDIREVNAAVAEAKAESASSYQDQKQTLTALYKQNNLTNPTGKDADDIEKNALAAAQSNGVFNTYLIMTSNKIGMGSVMSGFKPIRQLTEAVGTGILEASERSAAKTGAKFLDAASNKWLAFKQSLLRSPVSYLRHNLDEALQENLQDVSHDATKAYYQAKYGLDHKDKTPTDSIQNYITTAAANQFTVSGAKTFISGFFTGAILGPGEHLFEKAGEYKQFITNNKGYKERVASEKLAKTELISQLNEIYKNPLEFSFKKGDANIQANLAGILGEAVKNNDRKAFHDIQDDAVRTLITSGLRSGTIDTLVKRLDTYSKQLKPEEFTKMFGIEHTSENVESLNKQLDSFKERVDEIKEIHENISDKLKNPFNLNKFKIEEKVNTNEDYVKTLVGQHAWNEAIESLVFNKSVYNDAIRRQSEILTSFSSNRAFSRVDHNTIYTLTNSDHLDTEISTLHDELKGLAESKDVGSKILKSHKQKRLDLLTKYKEHLDDYENAYFESQKPISKYGDQNEALDARQKAYMKAKIEFSDKATPLFNSIVNADQVANNKPQLDKNDIDKGFLKIHDYIELQRDASNILDKINLLADPVKFSKYFTAHSAYSKLVYNYNKEQAEEAERKKNEPTTETHQGTNNPGATNTQGTTTATTGSSPTGTEVEDTEIEDDPEEVDKSKDYNEAIKHNLEVIFKIDNDKDLESLTNSLSKDLLNPDSALYNTDPQVLTEAIEKRKKELRKIINFDTVPQFALVEMKEGSLVVKPGIYIVASKTSSTVTLKLFGSNKNDSYVVNKNDFNSNAITVYKNSNDYKMNNVLVPITDDEKEAMVASQTAANKDFFNDSSAIQESINRAKKTNITDATKNFLDGIGC